MECEERVVSGAVKRGQGVKTCRHRQSYSNSSSILPRHESLSEPSTPLPYTTGWRAAFNSRLQLCFDISCVRLFWEKLEHTLQTRDGGISMTRCKHFAGLAHVIAINQLELLKFSHPFLLTRNSNDLTCHVSLRI